MSNPKNFKGCGYVGYVISNMYTGWCDYRSFHAALFKTVKAEVARFEEIESQEKDRRRA